MWETSYELFFDSERKRLHLGSLNRINMPMSPQPQLVKIPDVCVYVFMHINIFLNLPIKIAQTLSLHCNNAIFLP